MATNMWHWVKNYCILDDGKSLFSPRHYPNLVLIEYGDSGFDIDYYVQAIEMLEDVPKIEGSIYD